MFKQVHSNSIVSYYQLKKAKRYRIILDLLEKTFVPLSDRQIKDKLGFSEMNSVRPRLNELINKGIVKESNNIKCFLTGKTVRTIILDDTYRIIHREKTGQFCFY